MKKVFAVFFALIMTLTLLNGCGKQVESKNTPGIGLHHAELELEGYEGVVKIELYGDEAPITVQNFMDLVNEGFYDGLTFMRVHKDFVLQGGDPTKTGSGGSDKKIVGEFKSNGYENNIEHKEGVLSMARTKDKNSATSQFFIMLVDYAGLDGDYAAFGKVTEGMEIIKRVEADYLQFTDPGRNYFINNPDEQPVIKSIVITD